MIGDEHVGRLDSVSLSSIMTKYLNNVKPIPLSPALLSGLRVHLTFPLVSFH